MQLDKRLKLLFYGVRVGVQCDDDEILKRVGNDFSFFLMDPDQYQNGEHDDLIIAAHRYPPDYDALPALEASFFSPRNICYSDGQLTYMDYFGRALSIYNREKERLEIHCDQLYLLHEIIYLSVLSRVGELLEKRRMHRVHALGFECKGESALFMMPSGCGKTTLALEILRKRVPFRLISEDSPLINAAGQVLPFPLRLGVLRNKPRDVSEKYLTYTERMEFEPKYLISLEAFGDSIATQPSSPRFVFIGTRTLSPNCVIQKAGIAKTISAFLRHMVVGVGLYQGVEFLLQSSWFDLVKKVNVFLSRVIRAAAVLRQSKVYILKLGKGPERNIKEIVAFLEKNRFGSP